MIGPEYKVGDMTPSGARVIAISKYKGITVVESVSTLTTEEEKQRIVNDLARVLSKL